MRRASLLSTVRITLTGMLVSSAVFTTGCQIDVGGQTLPSPYYLRDDVQYFPAGPEFQLTREAAAMRAYAEDTRVERVQ